MSIRALGLMLIGTCLASSAFADSDGEISSPLLSRCAGKAGLETRRSDAAFGLLALDGVPWLSIERTDDTVGIQPIMTTVTGTGVRHRRNGTLVPFRFTCVLDASGQALMFHASHLLPRLGDSLPPATIIVGTVSLSEKMVLARGVELQLQLRDVNRSAEGELLAEQVVRSGWQVPIPFALRLPYGLLLEDRKLVLTARLVLSHQVLYRLKTPYAIAREEIHRPLELTLVRPAASGP